jgi:hypothetical protein
VIIFLDFDGVLHPQYEGQRVPDEIAFCHLPRFETVMREFPGVEIVISSLWRYQFAPSKLKARFSEDIRQRIIGTTPLLEYADGTYVPAKREGEILQWLEDNGRVGEAWLALDDAVWQFQNHRDRVVACIYYRGFDDEAADTLRARLRR